MVKHALALVVIGFAAIPSIAAAQNAPAPRVHEGQHVWLTMDSGPSVEGHVDHVTGTDIVIDTDAGLRTYSLSTVRRIEKPDSVWNGALLVTGSSLGVAILGHAVVDGNSGTSRTSTGQTVRIIAGFVAVSAGIGAFIDSLIPGRDVVWQQPGKAALSLAPIATLHGIGVTGKLFW